MSLKNSIDQVMKDWPKMIKDLKKVEINLSRRPNKPPSHTSQKQLDLIENCKHLAQTININTNEELLSLEMFVEWTFDKMHSSYRKAKWMAMLGYQKKKYGIYQFPRRSTKDPRESQYYNMISLLRNSFRGKTVSIKFDRELLSLPYTKEWITVDTKQKKEIKIYTKKDWQEVLDFVRNKYGKYKKPKRNSDDPQEKSISLSLLRIRAAYKKNKLSNAILKMPMAREWIMEEKKNDTDYWLEMLIFISKKYNRYIRPNIRSIDQKERKFAAQIQAWRTAIKNNAPNQPDPKVFDLPKAHEWLILHDKIKIIKNEWQKYISFMKQADGTYKFPTFNSKDSLERRFYSLIRKWQKELKSIPKIELEYLFELPMAEEWLTKTSGEIKACEKWMEMLDFLKSKYGYNQKPGLSRTDSTEKYYYLFVYNFRRNLIRKKFNYNSLLKLPMAEEWILSD